MLPLVPEMSSTQRPLNSFAFSFVSDFLKNKLLLPENFPCYDCSLSPGVTYLHFGKTLVTSVQKHWLWRKHEAEEAQNRHLCLKPNPFTSDPYLITKNSRIDSQISKRKKNVGNNRGSGKMNLIRAGTPLRSLLRNHSQGYTSWMFSPLPTFLLWDSVM